MLESTKIIVSPHALQRYHERIQQDKTKQDIQELIRQGQPAGKKLRRIVLNKRPLYSVGHLDSWVVTYKRKIAFICRWLKKEQLLVVTCWAIKG